MTVNGGAWFLLNGWVDLLSLLLGARLTRTRLHWGRALLSAALGGAYALLAEAAFPFLRGPALLLGAVMGCTVLACGRRGLRAFPAVLAAGTFFGGCCSLWLASGLPKWCFFPAAGLMIPLLRGLPVQTVTEDREVKLTLYYGGRTLSLPVLRDSGNTLRDPVTGLPVIVLSARAAQPLFPFPLDADDLSALPEGFRLIRAMTAAGTKTLMCFHPDRVTLRAGRRSWDIGAVAALSAFRESRAILPEILLQQEAQRYDAVYGDAEMDASVLCPAQARQAALHRRGRPPAPAPDPGGGGGIGRPPARG